MVMSQGIQMQADQTIPLADIDLAILTQEAVMCF
jgi:hypothetical protein